MKIFSFQELQNIALQNPDRLVSEHHHVLISQGIEESKLMEQQRLREDQLFRVTEYDSAYAKEVTFKVVLAPN